MIDTKITNRSNRAMTIMEMIISMAIMAIIFAAIIPQFRLIQNSWDSKQGAAETLQNGRVLIDHLNRNLAKAVRVTTVSDAGVTDGYIEFEDSDGNTMRYEIVNSYVQYGQVGALSDLAGPVDKLQFTCYALDDMDTPITELESIRFVKVDTTLPNSAALGQDKDFTAAVFLHINTTPFIAQPIVYEPFNYTAGNNINGTATNAMGLTGNWSGKDSLWLANSQSYSTLPTEGGATQFMVNKSGEAKANLDPAVMSGYTDDGETLWFSVVINACGTSTNNRYDFFIGDKDNGMGFRADRVNPKSSTVRLRACSSDDRARVYSSGSATYTVTWWTPRLIVGKLVFGATDTCSIYLPGPDLALPAACGTVTATIDKSKFSKITFDIGNGNTMYGDEFRMGTTYDSVIGISVVLP